MITAKKDNRYTMYTKDEAAKKLNTTVSHIDQLINQGDLEVSFNPVENITLIPKFSIDYLRKHGESNHTQIIETREIPNEIDIQTEAKNLNLDSILSVAKRVEVTNIRLYCREELL